MVIQNIWDTFDTYHTFAPPPSPTISIQQSPYGHHLDPLDTFNTFETSFISVERGYSMGNSDYLGPFDTFDPPTPHPPPPQIISNQPSPQAHYLDPFDTFDATLISV